MGKLVCEVKINGEDVVKALTTATGINVGIFLKTQPGVGKPFWYWSSIPAGTVIAADFTNAPIVSSDVNANNAAIAAITVDPADVLTYAT
ncbi:MAG TPA: hypothetical protein VNR39_12395 [Pseudolabrys sp.]|nr:hypothetical protein [Pseudolabrys sp.]